MGQGHLYLWKLRKEHFGDFWGYFPCSVSAFLAWASTCCTYVWVKAQQHVVLEIIRWQSYASKDSLFTLSPRKLKRQLVLASAAKRMLNFNFYYNYLSPLSILAIYLANPYHPMVENIFVVCLRLASTSILLKKYLILFLDRNKCYKRNKKFPYQRLHENWCCYFLFTSKGLALLTWLKYKTIWNHMGEPWKHYAK